jgi:3-deoxy-D-manno-octulosonate 8-phosphate phosphatase (KDO 8-P phosphatase)
VTLAERCRAIELLVLDVDGVLTDGGIVLADDRTEVKHFHVRDGLGLVRWRQAGKRAAILSGRASLVTPIRAAELGVSPVLQTRGPKAPAFADLLAGLGLEPRQVAFMGDDEPDVPVLERCGLALTVADASPGAVRAAHYVTLAPGGRGAVREAVELILRCQGG